MAKAVRGAGAGKDKPAKPEQKGTGKGAKNVAIEPPHIDEQAGAGAGKDKPAIVDEQAKKPQPKESNGGGISELEILHQRRVKMFGAGYIVAEKDGSQTIFSAITWKNLPADKHGWAPVKPGELPEVAKLKSKK